MNKIIGTIIAATALAAATQATAQVRPTLGFNSLENAVVAQAGAKPAIRTRLFSNVGLAAGNIHLEYSGFNEGNNLDKETWFGRQAVYLSAGGPGAALVVRNGAHAIYDVMAGVHVPVTGSGLYGFVDVVAGKVDGKMRWNTTGFVGHDIAHVPGGKLGGWLFWSANGQDLRNTYTEAQLEYTPGRVLGVQPMIFARYEQTALGENARGLVGVALQK